MIDFKQAVEDAVNALKLTNTVCILDENEKETFGYDQSLFYVSVETEYLDKDGVAKLIQFHLRFPSHFPLFLPKVILPKSELIKFKDFPHVEDNGNICTFDPESTRTNPNDPPGIARECLRRAKSIIEAGLFGVNEVDYEIEFRSYWEKKFNDKDEVNSNLLLLSDGFLDGTKINFVKLAKRTIIFDYLLHQCEPYALRFLSYLTEREIKVTELPAFYLGTIPFDLKPPFCLQNHQIVRLVQTLDVQQKKEFRAYINGNSSEKYVFATIITQGKPRLIGWQHKNIKIPIKRNGFRKGAISRYQALSSFHASDFVTRFSPTLLSPSQKQLRTGGTVSSNEPLKFLVAGLGSIGSNLIHYLNSFIDAEFRLIDYDILTTDNIGRHFLGYNYIPLNKAKGVGKYLQGKNPFQKIEVREQSVIEVYINEPQFVNDVDYIFLVTGKTNVEEYLATLLKNGQITKPVFLIWVEPYLSAGHCLFLYPNSKPYEDFFNANQLYKYNVIADQEYLNNNEVLRVKEAGCQTTFMPYTQSSITLFLATSFQEIKNIITYECKTSRAFSWLGDLQYIKEAGVQVKNEFCSCSEEILIIHE